VEDHLRLLIVNADDFGYSRGVNRGIVEAHERGIVTSASLMVNRTAAAEAADYGRDHQKLAVGLHVELRRWRVQRRPWSRVWSSERLHALVASDVVDQLDRFRALIGRDPTHLDSHHHRHRQPTLRPIFEAVVQELDVPLRHLDPRIRFCGDFYGHDSAGKPDPASITPVALVAVLEALPAGVVELGCHPGYTDGLDTWYREERVQEVETLCDPTIRDAVDRLGIDLISFRDLADRLQDERARSDTRSVHS
jgi:chitin disaccharide deacetylase